MKLLLAGLIIFLFVAFAEAGEYGINLYGFSYHPDRVDSRGRSFHEWNPGAGFHYLFRDTRRTILDSDLGVYSNSLGKLTVYGSAGYKFKIIGGLSAGAAAAVVYSPGYNDGTPFPALVPIVSYRYRKLAMNFLYIPEFKDLNRNDAIGFYFTFFLPGN
jgi:hypothetical protein